MGVYVWRKSRSFLFQFAHCIVTLVTDTPPPPGPPTPPTPATSLLASDAVAAFTPLCPLLPPAVHFKIRRHSFAFALRPALAVLWLALDRSDVGGGSLRGGGRPGAGLGF